MNPIDPLMLFMFSVATESAWGSRHREPDDEHPEPWLPDFIKASWPDDTVIGPQHPSNLPGFDSTKVYKAVFTPELGWVEIPPPGIGEANARAEESENGSS